MRIFLLHAQFLRCWLQDKWGDRVPCQDCPWPAGLASFLSHRLMGTRVGEALACDSTLLGPVLPTAFGFVKGFSP